MASQDNQVMQTTIETGTTPSDTVKNVTGYIHFNKDDDLTKIFETLQQFRTSHKLKYYHHRNDFIFFSVKSDCLGEFAKVQKFKISHYNSKSMYDCTKDFADKLLEVRDSFVRLSWNEESGQVQFLSRTIGRVHNELVRRVFKTVGETFDRSNYHFVPHVPSESGEQGETKPEVVPTRVSTGSRGKRGGRGGSRGGHGISHEATREHTSHGTTQHTSGNDSFTKVVRNKSKYNKNKVKVENSAPRTRGTKQRKAPPSA
jgi:hypothetical protein